eukprot:TRINITY_DN429_c1_g1_i2.p2 TRINITY_DN429_c1_g1~~TRINITY_DN429_c1_g1_i2.p2  ORF type:complete len:199 (+),score=68.64 TRINITY_DN429_c1_g1_i2:58-654(+)
MTVAVAQWARDVHAASIPEGHPPAPSQPAAAPAPAVKKQQRLQRPPPAPLVLPPPPQSAPLASSDESGSEYDSDDLSEDSESEFSAPGAPGFKKRALCPKPAIPTACQRLSSSVAAAELRVFRQESGGVLPPEARPSKPAKEAGAPAAHPLTSAAAGAAGGAVAAYLLLKLAGRMRRQRMHQYSATLPSPRILRRSKL